MANYDSNLDELESLLRDLDGRKSVAVPSSRKTMGKSQVNMSELDDIIGVLGEPSPPPMQKVVSPKPVEHRPALNNPTSHQHNQYQPQRAQQVSQEPVSSNRNTLDNIDDLLRGLEQPSRASRPISVVKHNDNEPFAYNSNRPNNVPVQPVVQAKASVAPTQYNYNSNSRASVAPTQYSPQANQKVFVAKPPSVRPVMGDDLSNLLDDITKGAAVDMSSPTGRGVCAACGRNILGEVISALGKNYHPEHFQCGNCRNPLGTANFFEQDGVPHCEKCYQELLCARCAHCEEPILDRCVTAIGRKWHMHHFICTQCLAPFNNGTFFERDNRPYCDKCFSGAFAPRCAGCNQPVTGECTNALGQSWHPEHFVCQYCQKSFTGSYYEFGGKPYCDVHYHQQTGSLCAGCGKAVTGKCVNALDKRWHPEHFVCAFCMNPLMAGNYAENGGKAYCRDCHGKLFG
jgi:paxillin